MNIKEHKQKTVSALKWKTMDQLVSQMITLGIGILLMRYITPKEFGLLGMVSVFSGFMIILADFGLSTSLIHKKKIDEIDKNTLFYVNLLIGIFFTLLLFFGSTYIANFYNTPELSRIAKYMSILFTIQAFGMVQSNMIRKELKFKLFFIIGLINSIIGGVLALYLALHNYGVWALVYMQLVNSILATIIFWFIGKWHPKFIFSFDRLKEHLGFSLPLLGSRTLNYWSRNADNLLIGKFLGSGALGLYSKAYALMMLPLKKISGTISSVMLSSFSLIQDDKERIKLIYLKMSRVIAFITFPMMGILFISAKPLVAFAFGEKWMDIVFLLKVFSLAGAIGSIVTLNGNIYISQGKTAFLFKLKIFTTILNITAIVVGLQFGIKGVAIGFVTAVLIKMIPNLYFMGNLINLKLIEIFNNLKPHILITFVLVLIGLFTYKTITNLSDIAQVLILTLEYCLGWILLMRLFASDIYNENISIIKKDLLNR